MAGYLGNNPSDSSVRIARQIYTTSGVTTDFTFTSGYDPGYIDVYVNGERQTEGTNFTANDGSTVIILNGGVSTGSTVECAAYKTFNVATVTLGEVTDVDDLTITGAVNAGSGDIGIATIHSSGIDAGVGVITAASYVGDGSALTGLASTDIINAEQVNVSGSTTTGIATVSTSIVVGSAVTVTATAININPTVTTTIGDSGNVDFNDDAKARFGTGNDLSIYHSGSHSFINDSGTGNLKILSSQVDILNPASNETIATFAENGAVSLYYDNTERLTTTSTGAVATGILTAVSDGNSGVVLHRTFGGDVSGATNTPQLDFTITDTATSNQVVAKISPQALAGTGDAFKGNLRFFTANDGGTATERLRIDSSGRLLVGATGDDNGTGALLQVADTAGTAALSANRYTNTADGPSRLYLFKSRGTSVGTQTIVQDGDDIGEIVFHASDGTDAAQAALIRAEVDGTPGDNDMPGRLSLHTTADGAHTPTERLRIDSSGRVLLGTTDLGDGAADNLTIEDSGNSGITIRSGSSNNGAIFFSDGTAGNSLYEGTIQYDHTNNELYFRSAALIALTLDSSQNATFNGSVADSKGNVRKIIQNYHNASTYTLVAADAGKHVLEATNAATITVPNSVFGAGDAVTIVSYQGSGNQTIAEGAGFTLYNAADASTGNRTLATRGMATILFVTPSIGYISGAGLS
jgi:hypothetical protein